MGNSIGPFNPIVWDAAGSDSIERLDEALASHGYLIDTPNPNEFGHPAPIHHAAKNGRVSAVETLVGADGGRRVDLPDIKGRTAMHYAAEFGHADVIEALVRLGSRAICMPDNHTTTPVCLAAQNGHAAAIKALARLGNRMLDLEGPRPLRLAAANGHAEAVETLVRLSSRDIDENYGSMHEAAREGHVEVIETLVRLGSKQIDSQAHTRGFTPMHCAADGGHVPAIEALVRLGSRAIDMIEPTFGLTPLGIAAMNAQTSAIVALVRLGSKLLNSSDYQRVRELRQRDSLKPLMALGADFHDTPAKSIVGPIEEEEVIQIRFRAYFEQSLTRRLVFELERQLHDPSPADLEKN